jgi:ABC-2 type transport system permease protein
MSNIKKNSLALLVLGLLLWGIKNIKAKLDLTADQRFTTSEATKTIVQNIDSTININVYLTGSELPSGFKRLENAIETTLADFKDYAGNKLTYKFIDPNSRSLSETEKQELQKSLVEKGLNPTNIFDIQNGRKSQLLVWPAAVINKGNRYLSLNLLNGSKQGGSEVALSQSIENIEYVLANGIRSLTQKAAFRIGYFSEYSSADLQYEKDFLDGLNQNYKIFFVDLAKTKILSDLDAILIVRPKKVFGPAEQFKIDQFIVKGGKALFFLDPVSMEKVGQDGQFASPKETGLEPLFYKYGVRLNTNLLKDYQMCSAIPLNVGNMGNQANIKLVPWPYHTLATPNPNHVIGRNLDAVIHKFASTIDTVKALGIQKTPLLQSTPYTQCINAPATISYQIAGKDFNPQTDAQGPKATAYLLEGSFESAFANQILTTDTLFHGFVKKQAESKILICSDADILTNTIDRQTGTANPLGLDPYSGTIFSNKTFVFNAFEYLLNPKGLLLSRKKEFALRPIDKVEITQNASYWQALNLIIPLVGLALLALIFHLYQKTYKQRWQLK